MWRIHLVSIIKWLSYIFRDNGWDFLPARVWVGLWTALYLLIIVAFDMSSMVKYITRFTEESFACLIALIFIYQAVIKTCQIQNTHPMEIHPYPQRMYNTQPDCMCIMVENNTSMQNNTATNVSLIKTTTQSAFIDERWFGFLNENTEVRTTTTTTAPVFNDTRSISQLDWMTNCTDFGGMLVGNECDGPKYVPDVFLFSILLFMGTTALAFLFIKFRHSLFCPTFVSVLATLHVNVCAL